MQINNPKQQDEQSHIIKTDRLKPRWQFLIGIGLCLFGYLLVHYADAIWSSSSESISFLGGLVSILGYVFIIASVINAVVRNRRSLKTHD